MSDPRVTELVRRAVNGDLNAYGEVVDRFRDAVLGLCYHRCGNFETARDLAQDTFVRAYQHLGQLGDPASFSGWLRRIAERICIDWRRGQHEVQPLAEAVDQASPSIDDTVALRVTVERALASLPEAQRLAVTLFHIDGYSYREIADFVSAPETTVKARLDAARKALREALDEMVHDALQAQGAPPEFREEVMMRVTQVQLKKAVDQYSGGPAPVVLLGDDAKAVAIYIGEPEASSIRMALDQWQPPRPMTSDLMLSSWSAFSIRLTGVRITEIRDHVFHAELELTRGKSTKQIDCRASDAVSLALRADVPIEVAEDVVGAMGISAGEARLDYSNLPDYQIDITLPPLHQAAADGNTDEVKRLLSERAEPDDLNRYGVTPLHLAAMRNRLETARLLIAAGADAAGADPKGKSHLHFAAHFGHSEMVALLLGAGADVNAQDHQGATPLHVASDASMVGLLASKGADAHARDHDGRTPLHYAASNNRTAVAEALLAAGADAAARDAKGATPLAIAEDSDVKELLCRHGGEL